MKQPPDRAASNPVATPAIVAANSSGYPVALHMTRFLITARFLIVTSLFAGTVFGCSNIEKARPQPTQAKVDRSFVIDVPEIMRGTISSETVVLGYESPNSPGYEPVVARGYGLVVGLNGTGSRNMPAPLRAHMLALAARQKVGSRQIGDDNALLTPERLLDSMDTAVVVVEAIIPQGAPKGKRFDVRVIAEPQTDTTSLEGGTLWTTDLRPGLPTAGGSQAFPLAQAYGPVFVNPFADPGAISKDTVVRTAGRVLNGGVVTKDMPVKLRLANPSHARAADLQTAINSRFPQEYRQRNPTARGESEELLEITIPPSFADRTDEFIELLRHTSILQSNPEVIALGIRRALLANPMVANAATLRWQALGPRVLPILKDLYDHPEEVPRLAALQAGAKLNDALAVPHLLDMAQTASADARLDAIRLLSKMESNPRIDLALRTMLDADDVEVRLEAYEALVNRADPYLRRHVIAGKYVVDVVESTKPMVYVTQIGQPRIVIFGTDLAIERPATVSMWSNQFMLKGDTDESQVEVYYRSPGTSQGVILRAESDLERFVQFLGHKTTIEEPAPGLALTYGEAVGVVYQIWKQNYLKADFRAEQDRILAAIARLRESSSTPDRPEFTATDDEEDSMPLSDLGAASDLGRLHRSTPPLSSGTFDPLSPNTANDQTSPNK